MVWYSVASGESLRISSISKAFRENSNSRVTNSSLSLYVLVISTEEKALSHENRPTPFPPMDILYSESAYINDAMLDSSNPMPLSVTEKPLIVS